MKLATGQTVIANGQFVDGTGGGPVEVPRSSFRTTRSRKLARPVETTKVADPLVADGDKVADIPALEDRSRFVAVMQGGIVKAGRLASGWREPAGSS